MVGMLEVTVVNITSSPEPAVAVSIPTSLPEATEGVGATVMVMGPEDTPVASAIPEPRVFEIFFSDKFQIT